MDEGRIRGIGKQVSGSIKEIAGKTTGDAKTAAEGTAERTTGKVQYADGGAKDKARDVIND